MASFSAVSVPSWPTCSDCLSWSSDSKDLAVAGGETVHIISCPRSDQLDAGYPDTWQVYTFRANIFSLRSEWPYQTLAPLQTFSVGEEQSASTVSALAWSHAGLGVHRRSVLCVLTTNLVLSIWESDGTPGNWDRTCIVNRCLQDNQTGITRESTDAARRTCRIRSFAWIRPVRPDGKDDHADPSLKRRVHHLVIADDGNNILVLEVQKNSAITSKGFVLKVVSSYELPGFTPVMDEIEDHSLFSLALRGHTTVHKLQSGPWEKKNPDSTIKDLVSKLTVSRRDKTISLQLALVSGGSKANPASAPRVVVLQNEISANIETREKQKSDSEPLKKYGKQLQPLCQDFDAQYKLGGNYRLHPWGEAAAPDQQTAALCVTLHPTDVIEYTTPAYRKSTVLICREPASPRSEYDLQQVYKKLLTYTLQQHSEAHLTELDRSILRAAAAFAYIRFADDRLLEDLSRKTLDRLATAGRKPPEKDPSTNESGSSSGFVTTSNSDVEKCEICLSQIPFQDPSYARCLIGHVFTRCNMSFVPIQKPAISKYCSDCGKQFLDLAKLEPPPDQSFAPSLFEEFDTCPYCFGFFRG